MNRNLRFAALGGALFVSAWAGAQSDALTVPPEWLPAFTWRSIGPNAMGGRVTDIAVNPKDSSMFWVAFGAAGLAKTVNNGITFEHQFDQMPVSGVGTVEVAPSDPNVVWVGTGECNPRNSVNYGNGVYKSTDGGKTWTHMGLEKTFQTGRIVIHPKDPNTVYVAAMGRLWGRNKDRGVYKTTDGGKTWSQILYTNDGSGAIDMVMDPNKPDRLIVAMWERMRDGFDSHRGSPPVADGYDGYDPILKWGPGAGLHKTNDGGKTWKRLTKGLPASQFGRVGLDVWQKNTNTVFAVIDCAEIGKGMAPPDVTVGCEIEKVKEGFRVVSVNRTGPAVTAKIEADEIITKIDGKGVGSTKDFYEMLRTKKKDDVLTFTVQGKDGKSREAKVTLNTRLGAGQGPSIRQVFGFDVDITDAGMKVSTVRPGRPAAEAGLKVDDIVVSVDGKAVKEPGSIIEAVNKKPKDTLITVVVKREGKDTDLKFKMPEVDGLNKEARSYSFLYGGQSPNVQDFQGPNGHLYGGIYRSDDFGESWTRINSLNPRPMYFSQIRVDPQDDQNLYLLGVSMHRSKNGGATFTSDFANNVHSDHHAMWIDPANPKHMMIGGDGGFSASYDRGEKWEHLNNLALGQFYHVAVDNKMPYNVIGGLQDNGSWYAPSYTRTGDGIFAEDWLNISGGDGFICRIDPMNPEFVYSESQDGNMLRRNMITGESAAIRPRPEQGLSYRFNWNTPMVLSSHNPAVFYCGGNYVFKSLRRGDDLRRISPEIARTGRGTAFAISESPINPNVLWAGTDDGYLWITKDGGATWNEISKNLGVGKYIWVGTIEASRFVEGRAYVCLTAHRQDDDAPYLFMTEDYGQTWTKINGNLPAFGTSRCLREDIANPGLLYCGTEFGIFASVDRGKNWLAIDNNLPTVPIYDVAVHPTQGDLILATHGRSVWIGDISALRQFNSENLKGDAVLFEPKNAIIWRRDPSRGAADGDEKFAGQSNPRGTTIWYGLKAEAKSVFVEIKDATGRSLRRFGNQPTAKGLHKVQWDPIGAQPGIYSVTLNVDGKEFVKPVTVVLDPELAKAGFVPRGGGFGGGTEEDER